ncbi:hypothetical protein HOLleu_44469 [Holothuria leucospilota]|uniref:Uncharacterized protein n=1 Tax=Holothuria leucospilota TaxID=206669 RepID=A0A9Q0YFU4_HOLLE|nr:hypothetical protein HOLleu_44469 [Holothuria leucospilota]
MHCETQEDAEIIHKMDMQVVERKRTVDVAGDTRVSGTVRWTIFENTGHSWKERSKDFEIRWQWKLRETCSLLHHLLQYSTSRCLCCHGWYFACNSLKISYCNLEVPLLKVNDRGVDDKNSLDAN